MKRAIPSLSALLPFLRPCLVLAPCLLLASLASARQAGSLEEMMRRFQDPSAMRKMAAQAEAARQCMEGIDQSELERIRKRAEATGREVDRLCAADKKDEALAKAVAFGQEMRQNATIQKARECTKDMADMVQTMGLGQIPGVKDEPEPTQEDICS